MGYRFRNMLRRAQVMTTTVVIALTCCAIAVACRYTVRDIGFVDLRGPEYVVVVRGSEADRIVAGLQQRLKDSNVRCVVESDVAGSTTSDSNLSGVAGNLVVLDAQGRTLPLAEDGVSLELDSAKQIIEEALFTPTIERITEASCSSFAQLVLISGPESDSNQLAASTMKEAEQALRRIEPLLPRPLQYPVRTITVEFEERSQERAFIWSLGIDPAATEEPILAIVYGRGRLAGPAMVGDMIDLRETLAQLALVGESCECETDRAWLQERVIPIDWPKSFREDAADSLGFDPESPLVQAEVTRIVSRGPSSEDRTGRATRQGGDDIERLLLGYEETNLQPLDDQVGGGDDTVASGGDAQAGSSGSGVTATIQTGSGWDFDETSRDNDSSTGTVTNQADAHEATADLQTSDEDSQSQPESHGNGEEPQGGVLDSEGEDATSQGMVDANTTVGGSVVTLTLALVAMGVVALVVVAWIVLGGRGR